MTLANCFVFVISAEYPKGKYLGCFKDSQKERDLKGFNQNFPTDNTPHKCMEFCTTGSKLLFQHLTGAPDKMRKMNFNRR